MKALAATVAALALSAAPAYAQGPEIQPLTAQQLGAKAQVKAQAQLKAHTIRQVRAQLSGNGLWDDGPRYKAMMKLRSRR